MVALPPNRVIHIFAANEGKPSIPLNGKPSTAVWKFRSWCGSKSWNPRTADSSACMRNCTDPLNRIQGVRENIPRPGGENGGQANATQAIYPGEGYQVGAAGGGRVGPR